MKKLYWEILGGIVFVLGGTVVAYNLLKNVHNFWSEQNLWSMALIAGWVIVAFGYWNQGSIIHKSRSATHVSLLLPCTVFAVQCTLFVKGIYYHDYALLAGALIVNSAVVFDIYQIIKFKRHSRA